MKNEQINPDIASFEALKLWCFVYKMLKLGGFYKKSQQLLLMEEILHQFVYNGESPMSNELKFH